MKIITSVLTVLLIASLYFNYKQYKDVTEWEYTANETADMYNNLNKECAGVDYTFEPTITNKD